MRPPAAGLEVSVARMAGFSPRKSSSAELKRRAHSEEQPQPIRSPNHPKRVWITGASGFLGAQLLSEAESRGWQVECPAGRNPLPPGRHQEIPVGLNNLDGLIRAARERHPDAIIHAAALTSTAECEARPEEAFRANVVLTRNVAEAAAAVGAGLVYASTDLVFDGYSAPYDEGAKPSPLMVYGKTKLLGEEEALRGAPHCAIARCSLMFGPRARDHFSCLTWMLDGLTNGRGLTLYDDEHRTPADARCVAMALCAIVETGAKGVFHLGGPRRISRLDFGRLVARAWELPEDRIRVAKREPANVPSPRPADVSLVSFRAEKELGYKPPPLEESLADLAAMYPDGAI